MVVVVGSVLGFAALGTRSAEACVAGGRSDSGTGGGLSITAGAGLPDWYGFAVDVLRSPRADPKCSSTRSDRVTKAVRPGAGWV